MVWHLNKDSIFSMVMFLTALGVGLILGFFTPGGVPRLAMSNIFAPVMLIAALYAIHYLPAIYVGFSLLCVSIIFLVSDAFNKKYGIHSLCAVITVIISYAVLMQSHIAGLNMQIILMFSAALVIILNVVAKIGTGYRSKQLQHKLQTEVKINDIGIVVMKIDHHYQIRINDTIWNAESNCILQEGQRVIVREKRELLLYVEPDPS